MAYAEGRTFRDADSHIMELGDWLEGYADPDVRARLRRLGVDRVALRCGDDSSQALVRFLRRRARQAS